MFIVAINSMHYICDRNNHSVAYAEKAERHCFKNCPDKYKNAVGNTRLDAINNLFNCIGPYINSCDLRIHDFVFHFMIREVNNNTFWLNSGIELSYTYKGFLQDFKEEKMLA